MNRKRIAAGILTASLLLTFAACGEAPASGATDKATSSGVQSKAENKETGTSSADAGAQGVGSITQVFGKVTSVTGNEITLSLANPPEVEQEEESSQPPQGGGEIVAAVEMVPATEAIPGGGEAVELPKIELTYTGEEKDFQVPAGAEILGKDGTSATLDSLKKGNVIMLNIDHNNKITLLSIFE